MQRFYLSLKRNQHVADPPRGVCATAAYPKYMNFIVGRMIISDMRTSYDQYALLHRDAPKTRAVGEM
jgi:hypothetical protein